MSTISKITIENRIKSMLDLYIFFVQLCNNILDWSRYLVIFVVPFCDTNL